MPGGACARGRLRPTGEHTTLVGLTLAVGVGLAAQLDELGVEVLVTACANCRDMLEDGLEHHEMNVDVVGLTELVAQYLDEQEP